MAIGLYKAAIAKDRKNYKAVTALGTAYGFLNRFDDAIETV